MNLAYSGQIIVIGGLNVCRPNGKVDIVSTKYLSANFFRSNDTEPPPSTPPRIDTFVFFYY